MAPSDEIHCSSFSGFQTHSGWCRFLAETARRVGVERACGAGWKSAGAGRERARILKLLQVGAGLNFADAGRELTKKFNPRRILVNIVWCL